MRPPTIVLRSMSASRFVLLALLSLQLADCGERPRLEPDRKSTRLNSSHVSISYAVFCLKKKNKLSLLLSAYSSPAFPALGLRHTPCPLPPTPAYSYQLSPSTLTSYITSLRPTSLLLSDT